MEYKDIPLGMKDITNTHKRREIEKLSSEYTTLVAKAYSNTTTIGNNHNGQNNP